MLTNDKSQARFDTAYAGMCPKMRDDHMTLSAILATAVTPPESPWRLTMAVWWKTADAALTMTINGEPAAFRGSEN